jgi:hypothetical protein
VTNKLVELLIFLCILQRNVLSRRAPREEEEERKTYKYIQVEKKPKAHRGNERELTNLKAKRLEMLRVVTDLPA